MKALMPLLIVNDVEATLTYYINKLNFGLVKKAPVEGKPSFAIVKRGDVRIMFEAKEPYAQRNCTDLVQEPFGKGMELYIVPKNGVDGLHEEFKALSIDIIKPIHTNEYGMRQFSIRDLNGYVLTFKQYCPTCE